MAIQAMTAAERLRRSEVAGAVRERRAVAILRRLPPDTVDRTVQALLAGGFRLIELTVDSDGVFEQLTRLREDGRAIIGAGTIRRAAEVELAVEAGAQFLVAPTYQPSVVERALELGVPVVPGAFTATEIDTAWQQGATFVKLFPGAAVGPAYLRAVLAPLHDVEIVVTGGVDATTARSFLDAGAVAVGVSTAQLRGPATAEADHTPSPAAVRDLLAAVA